jgi:hypothetical protein
MPPPRAGQRRTDRNPVPAQFGDQRDLRADDGEGGDADGVQNRHRALEAPRLLPLLAHTLRGQRAHDDDDDEHQVKVGRIIEDERRIAIAADQQVAQRQHETQETGDPVTDVLGMLGPAAGA